jgi:Phage integrase, N-terminal SAM-like domain
MTALAPTVEAFFTQRLAVQRDASPHTVAAYRDTLRLLLVFAHHRIGKAPSRLDVGDIDATLVAAFLTDLETGRATACPPATAGHRHPFALQLRFPNMASRSSGCWPSPPNATSRTWCAS